MCDLHFTLAYFLTLLLENFIFYRILARDIPNYPFIYVKKRCDIKNFNGPLRVQKITWNIVKAKFTIYVNVNKKCQITNQLTLCLYSTIIFLVTCKCVNSHDESFYLIYLTQIWARYIHFIDTCILAVFIYTELYLSFIVSIHDKLFVIFNLNE